MSEWQHTGRPPFIFGVPFDVWDGKSVRSVRRVGDESRSITPGALIYTDCTHPLQNVLCDERNILAWRIKA